MPVSAKEFEAANSGVYKDRDELRKAWRELPSVQALFAAKLYFFEEFTVGRKEYVANQVRECFKTYAIIKDGEWISDVSGEDFQNFIDSLSDDTRISIYDCHM